MEKTEWIILDQINSLLSKPSLNVQEHIDKSIIQTISRLLEDVFVEPNVYFIRSLQRGNSGTMLVTSGQDLLVLKEHIHEENNWIIPFNVLNDIVTSLYFHQHYPNITSLPSLVSLSIHKNTTRIITRFIPLAFEDIFDRPLPCSFIKRRFQELMKVVALLHSQHFAHRDIKPENIRLRDNGQLVLIDFDTCCRRDNDSYYTRPCCSENTRAPELIDISLSSSYNAQACDIFACGSVFHAMSLDLKLPHKMGPDRLESIREFIPSSKLQHRIGSLGVDLLCSMLKMNPKERPCANDVLNHPFFCMDDIESSFTPIVSSLQTVTL